MFLYTRINNSFFFALNKKVRKKNKTDEKIASYFQILLYHTIGTKNGVSYERQIMR